MDDSVVAAMARWPNVPAVTGWLSLTPAGQWHLHEGGRALPVQPGSTPDPGSPITSPQIIQFIQRNYSHDDQGRWFFQNGPQRVYVRLDAAPLILRTTRDETSGALALQAHTGQKAGRIKAWWIDDTGRLFAHTDLGPALVAGRDMPELLEHLATPEGCAFTDLELPGADQGCRLPDITQPNPVACHTLILHTKAPCAPTKPALNTESAPSQPPRTDPVPAAPLYYCDSTHIPHAMGFDPHPQL